MAKAEHTRIEASIAGDALVVSSSSSAGAKVWRAPMALLSHATFELRETQGRLTVIAIPQGGTEEEVCVCPDRSAAIYALDKISAALFAGASSAPEPGSKKTGGVKAVWRAMKLILLTGVVAVFLVFVLGFFLRGGAGGSAPSSSVPVPADQLIGK